jgi:type IX secretion system PorP/SprF family membrane protein
MHKGKTRIGIILKFTLLLAFTGSRVMAQQSSTFNYNQYADNLTPVNPAYSLLDKAGSMSILGRKQLIGIPGAPTSLLFSGSLPIESINAAAGIFAENDKIAVESQTEINAFFAKAIQVTGDGYLSVSINAGIRSYVANYTLLDAADPQFSTDIRETKPNVGFGVMFYSNNFYIGLSVPELSFRNLGNASVLQADYLKTHYYFSGAFITNVDNDISFKPATLISYVDGTRAIFNVSGTFYLKNLFSIGANYSTRQQAAGIMSINFSGFRIGYSYEFGTSSGNLGSYNNATNEVSLAYRFGKTQAPKLL